MQRRSCFAATARARRLLCSARTRRDEGVFSGQLRLRRSTALRDRALIGRSSVMIQFSQAPTDQGPVQAVANRPSKRVRWFRETLEKARFQQKVFARSPETRNLRRSGAADKVKFSFPRGVRESLTGPSSRRHANEPRIRRRCDRENLALSDDAFLEESMH